MSSLDIDDKIINKAEIKKVDFKEISSFYEAEFLDDLSKLG
jgi:cysteinyl-tRNA synthetase